MPENIILLHRDHNNVPINVYRKNDRISVRDLDTGQRQENLGQVQQVNLQTGMVLVNWSQEGWARAFKDQWISITSMYRILNNLPASDIDDLTNA